MGSIKRGALIVIEGVDRSGKSTQCRNLVEALNSRQIQAELVCFPDRTTAIGGIINKYLKNEEHLCDESIHLLFAANRWERKEKMRNLLESGVSLVVDRYSYSGIVYSAVKKTLDLDWCKQVENGLLRPDHVYLLTLPESTISKRPDYGQERYENAATQAKVAKAFFDLSQEDKNSWKIIDANQTIQELHEILLKETINVINSVQNQKLEYLNFNGLKQQNGISKLN